jgi:hypothetical protein
MAKFIFTKDFSTRIPATGSGRASAGEGDGKFTVRYKIGDIIEGDVVPNKSTSEPPSYLVVANPKLKIGFGGRGWKSQKFFEPYSGTSTTSTPPTKSEKSQKLFEPYSGTSTTSTPPTKSENRQTDTSSNGSTPFVWTPMKKFVAGALAIGAVLGILKLTKFI